MLPFNKEDKENMSKRNQSKKFACAHIYRAAKCMAKDYPLAEGNNTFSFFFHRRIYIYIDIYKEKETYVANLSIMGAPCIYKLPASTLLIPDLDAMIGRRGQDAVAVEVEFRDRH